MSTPTIKLWHCHNARSLRPLWALEEMGLDYQLEVLPFPPRVFQKEYLGTNVLGTIPYFVDQSGEFPVEMTESSAICLYLVEHYQRDDLRVTADHPDYADYLNWLHHSDATLTFPQALILRYQYLEQGERRQPQVVEDYSSWYIARLRRLDAHLIGRDYLCADRFTIADIAIGYALYLGEVLGLSEQYSPQVNAYLQRLKARPAFQRSAAIGAEESTFKQLGL